MAEKLRYVYVRNKKSGQILKLQTYPFMGQNSIYEKYEPEEPASPEVEPSPALQVNDDLIEGAEDAEADSGAS